MTHCFIGARLKDKAGISFHLWRRYSMPAKKPDVSAAHLRAERERAKKRAQERLAKSENDRMLTTIAVYQSQTVKHLAEISAQLKEVNQTLLAVLSALETVH
jgi:hypothetical protein